MDTCLESKIQNKVKKILEKKGYNVIKVIQLSKNGYPDILALRDGQAVWVEVKRPGAKPRPLQVLRIKELVSDGFIAFYTDGLINWDKLVNL
jgi:Holliday junction resolvase